MTLSGYRRSGQRKRSNLSTVKHAAKKLFAPTPEPLTIQQIRKVAQGLAHNRRNI